MLWNARNLELSTHRVKFFRHVNFTTTKFPKSCPCPKTPEQMFSFIIIEYRKTRKHTASRTAICATQLCKAVCFHLSERFLFIPYRSELETWGFQGRLSAVFVFADGSSCRWILFNFGRENGTRWLYHTNFDCTLVKRSRQRRVKECLSHRKGLRIKHLSRLSSQSSPMNKLVCDKRRKLESFNDSIDASRTHHVNCI